MQAHSRGQPEAPSPRGGEALCVAVVNVNTTLVAPWVVVSISES